MKIQLNTLQANDSSTIGEMLIDGKHFCNTLEDVVRNLPEVCPNTPKGIACKCAGKVPGKTAIPAGTYKVILSYSNRFKRIMPEVLNVPHFLGIRIHKGNSSVDTDGCILVGTWDNKSKDWISNSTKAYDELMTLLQKAIDNNEDITITIVR